MFFCGGEYIYLLIVHATVKYYVPLWHFSPCPFHNSHTLSLFLNMFRFSDQKFQQRRFLGAPALWSIFFFAYCEEMNVLLLLVPLAPVRVFGSDRS